uniref:Cyclin N-terminal domain-containing protein n=1 Tax=Globodera pallida TaxID=36090 RepID=A0A183CIB6_GLOPA
MTAVGPTSSAHLGKKAEWRLTTEQISRLPSVIDGIDLNQELKMRQQAAQFIQDMADSNQACICVSMVHMHRFFVVHSFRMFDPRDVAAACLFLSGKGEECPRKLEHIVEAWFKLKYKKVEVQPPFTETIRRDGAELIVYLESVLLQTIGFDLQVELPHPLVLKHMNCYTNDNQAMSRCAYWFTSEMIRLTTFPVRHSMQAIACLSIFLVSLWSGFEIPDSDGAPWFKSIEPEMTLELLNKLADEFTLLYLECGSSECRKAVDGLQRQQQQQQKTPERGSSDQQQRQQSKRPVTTSQNDDALPTKRAFDSVPTPANNRTAVPGEKLQIPQIKLESNSPVSNSPNMKNCANEQGGRDTTADSAKNEATSSATKKKISLNEYKQSGGNAAAVSPFHASPSPRPFSLPSPPPSQFVLPPNPSAFFDFFPATSDYAAAAALLPDILLRQRTKKPSRTVVNPQIMLIMSLLCVCQLVQFSGSDSMLTDLFHSLFYDYNKEIRPVIEHNRPVNTNISFSLIQVVDVDERNQLLTSLAWIHFRWNDWRLAWDPRMNGWITKLKVPIEMIWKPDIILYNNAASEYLNEMSTASVTYDGNISLSMAGIFKSSCELDVRFYPFDFQNCLMKFASWSYDGTKIDIFSGPSGDTSNYMVSTEWTLREVRATKNSVIYSCCSEPYPFIDVYLLLERKPLFFVIFSCLPCVLISVLVLLGFYMPSDSGEKVTLGITSLLSTTVFLMLVSEHLPPTAEALPLIGIYYGVTLFIVSLQTAFTVFTLNIHHIGTHGPPVPRLLQKLLFGRVPRLLLLNLEKQYHSINEHVHYFIGKQTMEERDQKDNNNLLIGAQRPPPSSSIRRVQSANFIGGNAVEGAGGFGSKVLLAEGSNSLPRAKKKRVSFTDDHNICCQQKNGTVPSATTAVSFPAHRYGRRILSLISPVVSVHKHHPNCAKIRVATVSNVGRRPRSVDQLGLRRRRSSSLRSPSGFSTALTDEETTGKEWGGAGEKDAPIGGGRGDNGTGTSFENEFIGVIGRLQEVIERNELRLMEKDRRNAEKLEWQQVALVLDRFFLVLFSIGTALVLVLIVFSDQTNKAIFGQ